MKWLPIMPDKGVNLFDAPEALGNDECLKAKNLVPVTYRVPRRDFQSCLSNLPASLQSMQSAPI